MKILKNRGRKNKLIKKLHKDNEYWMQKYFGVEDVMRWNLSLYNQNDNELEELRKINIDLLDIKDKYYKLLQHIEINDREIMEIIK